MADKVVIDTNVILTASGQHKGVSAACVDSCSKRLLAVMSSTVVVIDDGYEVLSEYQNKSKPWTGNRVGDIFLKWLLNNSTNPKHCRQVTLSKGLAPNTYANFPDQQLQDEFDPPDRVFVAVAAAERGEPKIIQAADCKWLNWNDRLKAVGIEVDYVCPDDICRFFAKKFPGRIIPKF
jgi:hypothetical protein